MAEMPESLLEGSGRNPQEPSKGASRVATSKSSDPQKKTMLMEAVVERENMKEALRRVMANGGAAGVDEMTVEELKPYLKEQWPPIKEELLSGRYQPSPVKKVEIPKPGGGMRMLGIPTVVDRLIQQALHQVLTPILDPNFSESSYGFRPGRNAHQAVLQARAYVESGRRWVVDIDLEKFFDRVNHDILMARLARKVQDKRILGVVRRYLQSGMMSEGIVEAKREGTPQGGPLSPLLSNLLLDDLDKELERRGHRFCRYADDCNIYVQSKNAGERVLQSIGQFLQKKLKLKINPTKSAVARPWQRKFLGYSMTSEIKPRLKVARESIKRLRGKLKERFRKAKGQSISRVLEEIKPLLRGWIAYFRLVEAPSVLEELDGWIRRRLRCILWRQWKRNYTRVRNLIRLGLSKDRALQSAGNGRGPWWNSGSSNMNRGLGNLYFEVRGLVSLVSEHYRLKYTS